jgi:hypothetical protein
MLLLTDGPGLGNVLPRIGVHPHRETNRRRPTKDMTGIRDQHFAIQGLRSRGHGHIRLKTGQGERLKMDERLSLILPRTPIPG